MEQQFAKFALGPKNVLFQLDLTRIRFLHYHHYHDVMEVLDHEFTSIIVNCYCLTLMESKFHVCDGHCVQSCSQFDILVHSF